MIERPSLHPTSVEAASLHVAWVHELGSFHGGAERYIHDTARLLADSGVKSTLFYDPRCEVSLKFLEPFQAAFPIVDLPSQVERLEPDIVYLHRYEDHASVAALAEGPAPTFRFFHDHRPFCPREHKYTLLSKSTCQRRVGVGCLGCLGFVNRSSNGLTWRSLASMRQQWVADQSLSGCVVASQYMVGHVARHGFDQQRLHCIPLYGRETAVPASLNREADLLLFVGTLSTGKGLDLLLKALARLETNASRLVIIGDGPQRPRFEDLVSSLGLEERVSFAGSLAPDRVDTWYAKAACLVVPSRSPETFAMVGPEAMRHGTVVVGTDVGGVREWLIHEETGLIVEPGNPAALAAAMDRVLTDQDLRVRLGARAREVFEERFLPRHHVASLLNLFVEVIRQPCAA